jgi:hypothetical protein
MRQPRGMSVIGVNTTMNVGWCRVGDTFVSAKSLAELTGTPDTDAPAGPRTPCQVGGGQHEDGAAARSARCAGQPG